MKFLTPLDLGGNELRNARVHNLGTAPSSPTLGQTYYDTGSNKLLVWDGSVWQSARAADSLARANHTGTQLAATISNFDTQVRTSRLDQMVAPTGPVSMGSQKITALADPTSNQDAATKIYVDNLAQGLDVLPSVKAATTANITRSGPQTIDTVSVVAGDRVLVKNQTTASENGVYVVAAGSWALAAGTLSAGAFTFIESGGQANSGWVLGSSLTAWTQFSSTGTLTAGAGLVQNASAFDVVGAANRISVAADNIDIAATYVGQTSITTLGTITTGTWTGVAVGLAYGGTGATTATGARTAIAATGKYAASLPATATSTVTHSLNTLDVAAIVYETASGAYVYPDVTITDANNVSVAFATAPAANAYRIVVVG